VAHRFILFLSAWVLVLATSLGILTYLADPTGVRHSLDPDSPTLCPPGIYGISYAAKPVAFAASGLRVAAFGTSRVELGIDVSDPLLIANAGSTFNLALSAADMRVVSVLAVDAMSRGLVNTIVLGLDYGMFVNDQRDHPDRIPPLGTSFDRFLLPVRALAALGSARAAIRMIVSRCPMAPYRADGQLRPEALASEEWANAWEWKRETLPDAYIKDYRMHKQELDDGRSPYAANLQALGKLVESAARTRTRLIMFVNPLPATFLEIVRVTGHQDRFEQWKRDVATLAAARVEERPLPLRDFAVYAGETNDPFPPRVSTLADLRGFFELSHFTPALGALVLRRLFQENGEGDLFGAPLEPGTIDAHLAAVRRAGEQYRATHSQDVAWIERRAATLRRAEAKAR